MSDAIDLKPTLLVPDWPAPANVGAFVTTRETGPSQGDFAAFNPATHVGDNADHVDLCRRLLGKELGDERPLLWLNQVHGARVQQAFQAGAPEADAAIANDRDYACVVLTADCLPVLFCNRAGTQVAVAHAGWRGLATGVLEATVSAMNSEPDDILVWLGPAISNAQFEVGPEVYGAFVAAQPETADAFDHSPYRLGHHMADLYRLARFRLEALGIHHISGGHFCTACESRFYSYRRDGGRTGRMASVIWIK
ncbi:MULTISPECIES: peptidoglycan editing factor PgeF [Halomonadaceae]|jgi:YfiH family protein|uniref:Purine nucleoside phosphorylase n=1 Tax=Vreelandella janggokensis TaxID=370767 RepID=A0ABT4IYI3_9GAMM|nr:MULTISPECIES: peptidoglycan editing factor PgeF [Halomonas]MCO7247839.1 peptidoglycan editing factor PgeF [Halomonas sp. Mc5H-6]MCZ0928736.1 peptidoglycan editing factor PgeF [Halomonas janggokensis]OBA00184.1 multi-copper polyphenol oxidoreductase [Halomonas sp. G11]